MILRVDFDQFPQTVKRLLSGNSAYVSANGKGALASAADPKTGLLVVTRSEGGTEELTKSLEDQGMEVFQGSWSLDGSDTSAGMESASLYVAAVAYASEEPKPGLWIDAYQEEPTLGQVMRSMYDEFMANGEVPPDISLEEFIRLANPNVVILSPEQLAGYAEGKEGC